MSAFRLIASGVVCVGVMALAACAQEQQTVRAVEALPLSGAPHYTANREPLAPAPLVKLPIGSITPRGWLGHMLVLEKNGMSGHLQEISQWCKYEGNAWVKPEGGHSGWEEMPYWLKGYGDLGYVLKDEEINKQSRRWIEAILASQRADGWFGPRNLLTSLDGKADLWPNMIALNVLQSFHEATGDARVLPFMTNYFRWQLNYPEKDFLVGYWPKIRAGDNLESIYWLYNRTGEKWLLDLAAKVHRCTADWTSGVPNWHGVNMAQAFREPGVYYTQARDEKFIAAAERNYQTITGLYGQFPGGMYGADENARQGYHDPRQGAETCAIVEIMHSFEMLGKITGNPLWADRCEDVAFNSFPPSMTPDLKALHYITSANQVQLDRGNKAPGVQNSGNMFAYSPGAAYRCCQHNVAHGWPYYAEELWLATLDRGLCASLYSASEVSAKVGDGGTVKIIEETDYPFSPLVKLRMSMQEPARFPLYLRVPRWCGQAKVRINGNAADVNPAARSYVMIDRRWAEGDTVELDLPMNLSLRTWEKNNNSVSVDYGPLSFSLKIGEKWTKYGGSEAWPEWEVYPTTAWNYGLAIDPPNALAAFQVKRKDGAVADQPFTPDAAPISITAPARKIPQWTVDKTNLINTLQASPAKTSEPVEMVTLIPMGCARLRITAFPTVSDAPTAHEWTIPATGPAKAK